MFCGLPTLAKFLLSTYYVPHTVLNTRNTVMSRPYLPTKSDLLFWEQKVSNTDWSVENEKACAVLNLSINMLSLL